MNFPTLKLTATTNKLSELTLYEPIDISILDKLINSDLLKDSFHNPTANMLYSNERDQLIKYRNLITLGKAKVIYKRTRGMSYGRCNPDKALGLFCIRREIRQTLCKSKYVDIDIQNAHPSFLLQICKKYNIDCENLEDYVLNRQTYLNEVMTTYNVNKDTAKKLFIMLLYFGSFESWCEEIGIDAKTKPAIKNIKNFKKEIQEIGRVIVENNKEIADELKKNKETHNIKHYNETGGVVSYYLQEIECRVLEQLYLYCKAKCLLPNDNVCVLCADGLMILSEYYTNNLLNEFTELIKEKLGLDLVFTEKEMTQDYLNILDDHILTEELIIKRELTGYDMNIEISGEDFNVSKLNNIFLQDISELGSERFLKYFIWTKSFKYFNTYHAYFYISDDIYKIYKNVISCYKNFDKSFEQLHFTVGKTKYKFTTLYLESFKKQTYSTFHFSPNNKIIDDKYNLFNGFYYSTDDNTTYNPEIIRPFIDHIIYLCNEEGKDEKPVSEYLLNWFSHIIQKPQEKTNVAVVIYSITEGIGKNRVSDIISKLLKGYEAKFRDTSALTDKFNGEMMGKLFVVGDEINARAQEVANELKDIIVRNTENIEFKGKDKFLITDYKNYYFTTNNENIFKVSNTDRRFMFIECPEIPKTLDYYKVLLDFERDDVKMKHLFNYFLNKDISEFKTQNIIMTDYKKRLILANIPPYIKFIKERLDLVSGFGYSPKTLYELSIEYAKQNRMISTYTQHTFDTQFKKVFGEFNYLESKTKRSMYLFPDGNDTKERIEKLIEEKFVNCK